VLVTHPGGWFLKTPAGGSASA